MAGFGTGGSYETLPVNLLSAERDLGLRPEVARVSIVLGTVLNKNVATMAVLLVTVSTCALLDVRISMVEIGLLIPPVLLLGLESPGVPGGAGVFMSPVIASLLAVPDSGLFVTTFVTLYSGLIPMLATAGNTTDDGFVGAFINDRLTDSEALDATAPMPLPRAGFDPLPAPGSRGGRVPAAAGDLDDRRAAGSQWAARAPVAGPLDLSRRGPGRRRGAARRAHRAPGRKTGTQKSTHGVFGR